MTLVAIVCCLAMFGLVVSRFEVRGNLPGLRKLSWWRFLASELGAASVTYEYPVAGTVAPTAQQAVNAPTNVAVVVFADADTTATITHNWGLSTSSLARGNPFFTITQLGGGTPSPLIAVAFNSNTTVLSKQSTATGSGGSLLVQQFKHSILMPTAP